MNIKHLQQKFIIFILLVFTGTITSGCGNSPDPSAMIPSGEQAAITPPPVGAPPAQGGPSQVAQAPVTPVEDVIIKVNNQLKQLSKPLQTASNSKKVIIDVDTFGRDNPFKPFYQRSVVASSSGLPNGVMYPVNPGSGVPKLPGIDNSLPRLSMYGVNVDVPAPQGDVDPSIPALMGIKVAGILYDSTKPMAILNINGDDQLVQKGDKFLNYIVTDITRQKVCVKKGNNTFRAGIGQIIDGQVYDNSQYYNVNKHFAGKRYVINTETVSNYY